MCVSGYISKTVRVGRLLLNYIFSKISFIILPDFNKKHNRCVVCSKGSIWARNLSTGEKYDNKSGKTNNKWPQVGYVACDRISFFFGMPIKTLGLLEKLG